MKIRFDKLKTTSDTIQVSWDGGNTWETHSVDVVRENGIAFTIEDCSNFSLIKIKGKFLTSVDLDFVATAKEDNSTYTGKDLDGLSIIDENGVLGFKGDVTIPDGVTSIGDYAFSNCLNLTTINYTGTQEQWKVISKGTSWDYNVPSTCVINYNYIPE